MPVSRFAPSTTGDAHPGTLLAGLLAWLDARSTGHRLLVRFEDLDPGRCTPPRLRALREQLGWFGLSFDAEEVQSQHSDRHAAALVGLRKRGLVYACACSRRDLRNAPRAADGGRVYPGTCRDAGLPLDDAELSLRLRLPDIEVRPHALDAESLVQRPARAMGDPILRRRDGVAAYHLASVADDLTAGVERVVRGRDLVPSTAIQHLLFELLGGTPPVYRHHLLLLEPRGGKWSKFHQAVGVPELSRRYAPAELCGILAHACDLLPRPIPVTPVDLLSNFAWERVRDADRGLIWDGDRLRVADDG